MTIAKIVGSFVGLMLLLIGARLAFASGAFHATALNGGLALGGLVLLALTLRSADVLRGLVGVIGIIATLVGVVLAVRGFDSVAPGHMTLAYYGIALIVAGLMLEVWMTHAAGAAHNIFGSFGVLLILVGGIWVLQGLRLFPGTFMVGDIHWSYRGGVLAAFGLLMLVLAGRKAAAAAAAA